MNRKYPGFFITLEGPEGCGKTFHIHSLTEHLRSLGLDVFPTREPGGTSIGEQIRDVLHSLENAEMNPRTETLLYQAARAQFVEQVIKPKLERGTIVLSDRFSDSTRAYQGYGHRQDLDKVCSLIDYATGGLVPDLTILMDVPVEIGLERKGKQGEWNRMDAYDIKFHRRVREGYIRMAKTEPERFLIVDASKSKDEVYFDLVRKIEGRLDLSGLLERNSKGAER